MKDKGSPRGAVSGIEYKMDRVEACLEELLQAIGETAQMKRFKECRIQAAAHPECKGQIDQFRKKVFLAQNNEDNEGRLEEMKALMEEREAVRHEPLVAEYLDAELDVCRLLQHLCLSILNVTDLEIDTFENVL